MQSLAFTVSLQEAADHVQRDKSYIWRRVRAMGLGVDTGAGIRLSPEDIEELEVDITSRARKKVEKNG